MSDDERDRLAWHYGKRDGLRLRDVAFFAAGAAVLAWWLA
jgi:hypothetical protein